MSSRIPKDSHFNFHMSYFINITSITYSPTLQKSMLFSSQPYGYSTVLQQPVNLVYFLAYYIYPPYTTIVDHTLAHIHGKMRTILQLNVSDDEQLLSGNLTETEHQRVRRERGLPWDGVHQGAILPPTVCYVSILTSQDLESIYLIFDLFITD